jgi:hypothetical protein
MVTVSKEGLVILETMEIIPSKELGLGKSPNSNVKKILRREIFLDRSIFLLGTTDKSY